MTVFADHPSLLGCCSLRGVLAPEGGAWGGNWSVQSGVLRGEPGDGVGIISDGLEGLFTSDAIELIDDDELLRDITPKPNNGWIIVKRLNY